jgi:hypothetical protein
MLKELNKFTSTSDTSSITPIEQPLVENATYYSSVVFSNFHHDEAPNIQVAGRHRRISVQL